MIQEAHDLDWTDVPLPGLLKIATAETPALSRWEAMYELARRSILDITVLDKLLPIMRADRSLGFHYVPYGTYRAISFILDSGNAPVIRKLLSELDSWDIDDQYDAIVSWLGASRLTEATKRLQNDFGWQPKYA